MREKCSIFTRACIQLSSLNRVSAFQLLNVSLETVVYSEYSITVLQGLLLHYLISGVCTNADSVVCENILDYSTETFISTHTRATDETRFGYFEKNRITSFCFAPN